MSLPVAVADDGVRDATSSHLLYSTDSLPSPLILPPAD